jgi:very-short-patch-repair endonuclease
MKLDIGLDVANNDMYTPTEQEKELYDALLKRGIDAILGYNDGHKTVDIAILSAKIYIEVDGNQHFTDPKQIISDFYRLHYADIEDFNTFHVPNLVILYHGEEVADAIAQVVVLRLKDQKVNSIVNY